jgi:hypothetical protein
LRSRGLEEDVLLGGGDGFDDSFNEEARDSGEAEEDVVAPEDLETADEKRLRVAQSYLQKLVKDVRRGKNSGAGPPADESDEGEGEEEEEGEDDFQGITSSETYDLVADRLRARALRSSGGLLQPVSAAIRGAALGAAHVHGLGGHSVRAPVYRVILRVPILTAFRLCAALRDGSRPLPRRQVRVHVLKGLRYRSLVCAAGGVGGGA